jgi:drug/metabolite transporter (DMT)-like permease
MTPVRSTLYLFSICVLVWGSTWYAITFQLGPVAPEISVGYRFLLASVLLFGYCAWRGLPLKFNLRQHLDFLLLGTGLFGVGYVLVYYAESYIVSGMVAVVFSVMPMLNMLAARAIFGTRMTRSITVAALFGMAGIVCVFWPEFGKVSDSRNTQLGALFAGLAVLASCAGSMAATRHQKFGHPTWSSMAWGMGYGGAQALTIGLALGRPLSLPLTASYLFSLLYLAVLGSIVTFACYLTLIERIGAARSAYLGVMTPILALVISFFFEHYSWSWLTTLGVVLSVIGNFIMLFPARKLPGE